MRIDRDGHLIEVTREAPDKCLKCGKDKCSYIFIFGSVYRYSYDGSIWSDTLVEASDDLTTSEKAYIKISKSEVRKCAVCK